MKKIATLVCASLMACSIDAYAEENAKKSDVDIVLGIQGGKSFMYGDLSKAESLPHNICISKSDPNGMLGVIVGVEQNISDHLSAGIESGYQYFDLGHKDILSGGMKMGSIDWQMQSIPLMLKFKYSFQEHEGLNLFAKAGFAFNMIKIGDRPLRAGTEHSETTFNPVAAAGMGYEINNFNLFVQIQYNRITVNDMDGNLTTLTGGVSYALPM